MKKIIAASLMTQALFGCGNFGNIDRPQIGEITVQGVKIVEHLDDRANNPCLHQDGDQRVHNMGCHQVIGGRTMSGTAAAPLSASRITKSLTFWAWSTTAGVLSIAILWSS